MSEPPRPSAAVADLLKRVDHAAEKHRLSSTWIIKKLFGSVHARDALASGSRSPTQRTIDKANDLLNVLEEKGRDGLVERRDAEASAS